MTSDQAFPDTSDILVTGGYILCMDSGYSEFPDGAIAVVAGRIAAIGPSSAAQKTKAKEVVNASGAVVIPGLVNTHCHAAMTLFRGIADDRPLDKFLRTIWAAEASHLSYDTVYAGAALGIAEMVSGGITHFVDMYSRPNATLEAADHIGMNMTTGPSFVGFSRPDTPTWEDKLIQAEDYISKIKSRHDVQLMVMPHSCYTLDHDQLCELVALASRHDLSMHTHGSEAPTEMAQVEELHHGARPIEVFHNSGVLSRNALIAHAVHLESMELRLMARLGVSVSHCPLSNAKLASGMANIAAIRAAGVTVSLGTDGASSGNDLDLWKAMRHASFNQTTITGDPENLPAKEILAMATRNGAIALGKGDEFGTLEQGKRADIVLVDMSALHLTPSYDPYSSLVYSAGREDVSQVISRGRIVVKDRWITTDLTAEISVVREVAAQVKSTLLSQVE